jgi:hypothetical protein
VRVEEQVHEQRLDRHAVVADAVIPARIARGRVLKAVERALAGQRGAGGTARCQLAGENGQCRVAPQLVVVDQVLVAECDAEHPLADQGGDRVLDPIRIAGIGEADCEARDEADGAIGGAEQQRPDIRGDRPAVEAGDDGPTRGRCKFEQRRATLRRHRGPPLRRRKALSQKNFRRLRAPMHLRLVRNPG